MKSKRSLKNLITLIAFLFSLSFNMIQIDTNLLSQTISSPKTSDTHLIWDLHFSNAPDFIAISGDAKYVAGADYGGDYVTLFNSTTSAIIWDYSLSSTVIHGMDMSANGEYVIVGCHNHYVYVFNNTPNTYKTPFWSYDTGEVVREVAISAYGNYAVAGTSGANDYVILFNITNSIDPVIWESTDPTDGISSLAISSNGEYIAAGAYTTLYMYNKSSSTAQWSAYTSGGKEKVAISANGKYVAIGGSLGYIYLYDSSNSNYLWSDNLPGDILSIDMSNDGEYFVVGATNGICCLYNNTGTNPERYYIVDGYDDVMSVSISKNGNYVAAGSRYFSSSNRNTLYFYSRTTSTALWVQMTRTSIGAVALSSNGKYLVASEGYFETTLYFFTTLTVLPDPYSLSSICSTIGTTFVYELVEWNETLGNSLDITLADIDPTADVGEQRCYEITQITNTSNYWIISYKVWNWGSNFHSNTPYIDSIYVHVYPKDEGENIDYIHPDLMSIIPKPVDEYLEGIKWGPHSFSSGMSYTLERTQASHTFDLTINYDIEGYLKSMVWRYNNYILLNISYIGQRSYSSTNIHFGEFYLFITLITIVSLIFIGKRELKVPAKK